MADTGDRNPVPGQPKDEKKSFAGSCICKKITYTVDLGLGDPPIIARCNCTRCQKLGLDSIMLKPADLHLKTPCSTAECTDEGNKHSDRLGVLTLKTSPDLHRYFCDVCAVTVFSGGKIEHKGQKFDYFALNARTLDQPQEGLDFSKVKFQYYNGLKDELHKGPQDQPWAHGTV